MNNGYQPKKPATGTGAPPNPPSGGGSGVQKPKRCDLGEGFYTVLPEYPTIRDQMAMAALTGLLSNPKFNHGTGEDVIEAAYNAADLMMEARKKGGV